MSVTYRQAEYTLYSFPVNLMRWQEASLTAYFIRQETDCHAQNYEASHASEGTHADPVGKYYELLERAEGTMKSLAKKVFPVMRLRNFLKLAVSERYRTMFYVMELHYFDNMRLSQVGEHLQKSVKTIVRRKRELVDLTIEELERGVFDYELDGKD